MSTPYHLEQDRPQNRVEMSRGPAAMQSLEVHLKGVNLKLNSNDVLKNVNCHFRPGSMTLILGPPGCGKTSLLQVAAGYFEQIPESSGTVRSKTLCLPERSVDGYTGSVSYSGLEPRDVQIRNSIGYMRQYDQNLATLTVRETLRFALNVKASGVVTEEIQKEKEDQLLRTLGLVKCADTIVGDSMIRGVSGGEQKRVSLGETLAGGYATLFMDEFSTGLDTSATLDITRVLRKLCDEESYTVTAALLQPPPEVFELFDHVIVLSQGHIVYDGPREALLPYFESIGYHCPSRIDVADFVQIVTTPSNEMFRARDYLKNPSRPAPRRPHEFAREFAESSYGQDVIATLSKGPREPLKVAQLNQKRYNLHWYTYLSNVLTREAKIVSRDKTLLRSRVGQSVIMGLLVGTLFLQIATDQYQTRVNFLWYNMAFLTAAALPKVPALMEIRPTFYRHQRANFFPTWIYTLATIATQLPMELLEAVIYGTLTYWLGGLSSSFQSYIYYIMILFFQNFANNQVIQMTVTFAPNTVVAQSLGGVLIMIVMMFGGFAIGRPIIPSGWIWAYWINPLSYAFTSVNQNEFLKSGDFDQISPSGSTLGELYLETYGISTDTIWYIISPFIIVALGFVYAAVNTFGLAFVTFFDQNVGKTKYDEQEEEAVFIAETAAMPSPRTPENLELGGNTLEGGVGGAYAFDDAQLTPKRSFRLSSSADIANRTHDVSKVDAMRMMSRDLNTSFLDRMPFVHTTLVWKDLKYTVDIGKGKKAIKKEILRNIDGVARPSRMTALMGASGAGKTTLLDVLARRKNTGTVEGSMLFNGKPIGDRKFRRIAAYVEQFDRINATATVFEALLFSASLRLPQDVPLEHQIHFVENILNVLELEHFRDSLGKTLTLSQRKKLSVGVELVANPSVLFLDEPTSGLDSRAALNVIKVIRKISTMGRTIVCTVHQPSALLFECFDDLILLHSGRVVYSGELGNKGSNLIDYLETIPGTPAYKEGDNPASWMLEVIGAGVTAAGRAADGLEGGISLGEKYIQAYEKSTLCADYRLGLDKLVETSEGTGLAEDEKQYRASMWKQTVEMVRRLWRSNMRSPDLFMSKFGTFAFMCILLGTTYSSIGYSKITTTTEIIAIFASLFFVAQASWVISCLPELVHADAERQLFDKERSSNYYSVVPYTVAWGIVKVPLNILYALLFVNIMYWTVGYRHDTEAYLWFTLLLFLTMSAGNMAALTIVGFTPNLKVANLLGGLIFSLSALFAGLMVNENNMTKAWIWFYWIDPLHFFFEGVIVSQFKGDNRMLISPATGGTISSTEFVEFFFNNSFSYDHLGRNAGILAAFSIVFLTIFGISIKYINHVKR